MVTETKRAPRVVGEQTSMSAAAAAAQANSSHDNPDFAAAWTAVWQAMGGTIHHGERGPLFGCDMRFEPVSVMVGNVRLLAATEAERDGARNALAAMLRIAGKPAIEAVCAIGLASDLGAGE